MKTLPDAHTDFMFAVTLEPVGIVAAVLLSCLLPLALYLLLRR